MSETASHKRPFLRGLGINKGVFGAYSGVTLFRSHSVSRSKLNVPAS